MAKKRVVLQVEVTTEEEWQELLEQPGLMVLDIYCSWSGPCSAMVNVLRKVKMEIAGEDMNYAVVENDEIEDLTRFRGKSEPVWMFLEDGKMVNLMFGADAPKLQRLLISELQRWRDGRAPAFKVEPKNRGPDEEERWKIEEAIREAEQKRQKAEKEAKEKAEYEAFMAQMMFELCEMMIVVMYPWVFQDEYGNPKIKMQCPAYTDLVRDLLRGVFDLQEEVRLQLDEEMLKKLFVESDVEITKELTIGLTDGKCMVLRMKSRPPPSDWPVPYPHQCPEETEKCPQRAINDVEDYFHHLVSQEERRTTVAEPHGPRHSVVATYMEKYKFIHEADPEDEEDTHRIHPALWAPPQARSKVHAFMTLFPEYMAQEHPYEPPKPPPPLCAFKYRAHKYEELCNAYDAHPDAIEHFGVFACDEPFLVRPLASTPHDFEKVKKTGIEVFVAVIRKINEEAFLSFAGISPYYATEDEEVAQKIITQYFSEEPESLKSSEKSDDYYGYGEDYPEYYEGDMYY